MISKEVLRILENELEIVKRRLIDQIYGNPREVINRLMAHSFKIAVIGEINYWLVFMKNITSGCELTPTTQNIVNLLNQYPESSYDLFDRIIDYWVTGDITSIDMDTLEEIIGEVWRKDKY